MEIMKIHSDTNDSDNQPIIVPLPLTESQLDQLPSGKEVDPQWACLHSGSGVQAQPGRGQTFAGAGALPENLL